jgi:toxin ParE1/3/4
MARVLKREAAKRDLMQLWIWYAEQAEVEVAERFLTGAEDTLAVLSTQPHSGFELFNDHPQLKGFRRFPVSHPFENVLLFYVPLSDGIDLVRVVHGYRDLKFLLTEGFFG